MFYSIAPDIGVQINKLVIYLISKGYCNAVGKRRVTIQLAVSVMGVNVDCGNDEKAPATQQQAKKRTESQSDRNTKFGRRKSAIETMNKMNSQAVSVARCEVQRFQMSTKMPSNKTN